MSDQESFIFTGNTTDVLNWTRDGVEVGGVGPGDDPWVQVKEEVSFSGRAERVDVGDRLSWEGDALRVH